MFSRPEFPASVKVLRGLKLSRGHLILFGNGFFDTPFVFRHFGSNRIFCLPGATFSATAWTPRRLQPLDHSIAEKSQPRRCLPPNCLDWFLMPAVRAGKLPPFSARHEVRAQLRNRRILFAP